MPEEPRAEEPTPGEPTPAEPTPAEPGAAELAALARAHGLERLHARFPDELRAALATLASHARTRPRPEDVAVEPVPPCTAPRP